ncbi:MAG TPA: DUF4436 family protein [Pyrinomonadaceae bacterium]|jgi:hypothetical protein|nr:DUF4436 family protein [Pyrinomonadaceae bacterium]
MSSSPRLKAKGTVAIFAAVLVGLYVLVVASYFREEGSRRANIVESGAASVGEPQLEVDVGIISVDLAKEIVDLRLDFKPHGDLVRPDGSLAKPVTLYTMGVNGEAIDFKEGLAMVSRDVAFDLHGGEVTDYPFDTHRALIEFRAVPTASESNQPLRTRIDFYGYHHGLDIRSLPRTNDASGYTGFEVDVSRSNLVKYVAIFCMLVMWGLAFSAIMVIWSALSHSRELDTGTLALLSGLIIAIYFFRAGLPDTPVTIGTFSDYLAFFWAEAIVSVVTIIYTWLWFKRGQDN